MTFTNHLDHYAEFTLATQEANMTKIAEQIQIVKPSVTFAIAAKARALAAKGRDITIMTRGEPDFATPAAIKAAGIDAIRENFTKYTAIDGIVELKAAIIEKLAHDHQLSYALDQVIVCAGAKQAIFNAFCALLNPGDEVIIPAPYWPSYPEMVKLAKGKPVIASNPAQLKLTPLTLAKSISDKTKLVIINSPGNPSGLIYTKKELQALAAVLEQHPQVMILSDDIYEQIQWHGKFYNILTACPALYPRSLIINGVSKAYAMTGWRIGYATGPSEVIKAMKIVQSQTTSCANAIAQKAAVTALGLNPNIVQSMVATYQQRSSWLYQALEQINGIIPTASQAAFYQFANIKGLLRADANDIDLAYTLLHEHGLAVIPGTEFGMPGYIRLSFAASMEEINQAIAKLASFALKLD